MLVSRIAQPGCHPYCELRVILHRDDLQREAQQRVIHDPAAVGHRRRKIIGIPCQRLTVFVHEALVVQPLQPGVQHDVRIQPQLLDVQHFGERDVGVLEHEPGPVRQVHLGP